MLTQKSNGLFVARQVIDFDYKRVELSVAGKTRKEAWMKLVEATATYFKRGCM